MSKQATNNCYMVEDRRALFERLGGLPETTVQNLEWLYMLKEDTRQSLAIEGHFATQNELEAVLGGRKADLEIFNYFYTAQTVYDQGLQYYRDKIAPPLNLPVVRHIHSELFRGLTDQRGAFRTEPIRIHGARITPPSLDVEEYVRITLDMSNEFLRSLPILSALARAHTLFESVHPFADGNGRAGRILLNYLAVSKGYPPIVIKGTDTSERKRYYSALEAADTGFQKGFPEPTRQALKTQLQQGDFDPLILLLCEGLLPRLDRMTALALERQEPLLTLAEMAPQIGVTEGALRLRATRGRLITIKKGKKLYSHPLLALRDTRRERTEALA